MAMETKDVERRFSSSCEFQRSLTWLLDTCCVFVQQCLLVVFLFFIIVVIFSIFSLVLFPKFYFGFLKQKSLNGMLVAFEFVP